MEFTIFKNANRYKFLYNLILSVILTFIITNFSFAATHTSRDFIIKKGNVSPTILYVKPVGSGAQDGSSWENASPDIQAMINAASIDTQIWITKGIYKPIRPANNLGVIELNNRDNAFVMKDNVSLYGGFTGNETTIAQRDVVANPTLLSGDFNEDDIITGNGKTLTISNSTENANHIIINRGFSTIDGLTIRGGSATGGFSVQIGTSSINRDFGGGIYNINGILTLNNVTVIGNSATYRGAGIYTTNGSLNINNCLIKNNLNTMLYGGGIYQQTGNITMANCSIIGNKAHNDSGGGIYFYTGTVNIKNSNISYNYVNLTGGGIHNYLGALYITNSLISNNSSNSAGGGIISQAFVDTISKITNCTISNNTSSFGAGVTGKSNFINSIVWSNHSDYEESNGTDFQPTVMYHSLIEGRSTSGDGGGNIDGFNSSLLVFNDSTNSDYSLATGSPLIDKGNNSLYIAAGGNITDDRDLAGNVRLIRTNIDIGAYESTETMNVLDVSEKNIYIYPNPFTDTLKISDIKDIKQITLIDMSGNFIKQLSPSKEINLSYLKNGLYIITISSYDGSIKNFKIIKK